MKRIIGGNVGRLITGLIALLASFALASPAAAAPVTVSCANCKAKAEQTLSEMVVKTGPDAQRKVSAVISAVKDHRVVTHAQINDLYSGEAKVYGFPGQNDSSVFVTIPIHGRYGLPSNFTAQLDSAGNVTDYNETLITKNDLGNFRATNYTSGGDMKQIDTSTPYRSDAKLRQEVLRQSAGHISTMGNPAVCASIVFGVGTGLGALVASVCAGSCVGAASGVTLPICLACVGMFVAVGSGAVGQFVDCLNH